MSAEAYITMISRTNEQCYFLWDAVKDALVMELIDGNWNLFSDLCSISNETTAKNAMLIEVLTEYGQAYSKQIDTIITKILDEEQHEDAALIAIESSYNLGRFQLLDQVLERMAHHESNTVRQTAARFVSYLARENRTKAFKVLNRLAKQTRQNLVPNLRVILLCFQASSLILVGEYHDSEIVEQLRKVWVKIINNLLYTDWDDVAVIGNGVRRLREGYIARFMRNVVSRVFDTLEEGDLNTYDRADYERFFSADPKVRERYTRLATYLDIESHDIADAMDDLGAVVQGDDVLSFLIMMLLLSIRSMEYDYSVTSPSTNPIIPVIVELLNLGIEQEEASPSVPYLFITLGGAGRGYKADYVDDAYISLFEDCLRKFYRRHSCMGRKIYDHEAKNVGFGAYSQVIYLHNPRMESELINDTITDAIRREKDEFLKRYILDVADYTGGRNVWACLNGLQPVLSSLKEIGDDGLRRELQSCIVAALSRICIYAPIEVEAFLDLLSEQDELIREIGRRVHAGERKEAVGGTIQGRAAFLIRDKIIQNPDKFLLGRLIWWLREAPQCENMAEWFELLLRLVVNLIFLPVGKYVFDTPNLLSRSTLD